MVCERLLLLHCYCLCLLHRMAAQASPVTIETESPGAAVRPQPQRRIWRLRSPVPEVAESASTPPPKGGQVPAFSQEKRRKLDDLDQDDDDLLDPNRWLRVIDCEPKAWVCPSRFRRLEGIHLHYSRKCITCGATLPNDTCAIYGPLPAEEFDPNLVVPEDSQLPEDSQATQLPSNLEAFPTPEEVTVTETRIYGYDTVTEVTFTVV